MSAVDPDGVEETVPTQAVLPWESLFQGIQLRGVLMEREVADN